MAEPFNESDPVRKTYFINSTERNPDPTQDAGKVPQLDPDGFLSDLFIKNQAELPARVAIDGTVVPKAVAIFRGNTPSLIESDANGGDISQSFVGFTKGETDGIKPEFLYSNGSLGSSVSLTIPAGNNVMLFVGVTEFASGSLPSGYTFNGVAMTPSIQILNNNTASIKAFYLALGDIATPLTANLVRTGGVISGQVALAYSNVDQISPFIDSDIASNGADPALSNPEPISVVLCIAGGGNTVSIGNAGYSNRQTSGDIGIAGDFPVTSDVTISFGVGGVSTNLLAFILRTAGEIPTLPVIYNGRVGGFSSLVEGALYFISDTPGEISLTPGTTTIPVGIAVSETEILILPR